MEDFTKQVMMCRVRDERVIVICESPTLTAHFRCYLASFETDFTEPTVRIMILRGSSRDGEQTVQMLSPELDFAVARNEGVQAWLALKGLIEQIAFRPHKEQVVFHASAVARPNGNAALILAPSGAGTTALLLGLLRRGHVMACNDHSIVHAGGKLEALPTGMTLPDATLSQFAELCVMKEMGRSYKSGGEMFWTVNPAQLFKVSRPAQEFDVTHCFFLLPAFGTGREIKSCSRMEALSWLQAAHVSQFTGTRDFNIPAVPNFRRLFSVIHRLVRQSSCFHISSGNIEKAAGLIDEVFTE